MFTQPRTAKDAQRFLVLLHIRFLIMISRLDDKKKEQDRKEPCFLKIITSILSSKNIWNVVSIPSSFLQDTLLPLFFSRSIFVSFLTPLFVPVMHRWMLDAIQSQWYLESHQSEKSTRKKFLIWRLFIVVIERSG